jgi:hypothetical protein
MPLIGAWIGMDAIATGRADQLFRSLYTVAPGITCAALLGFFLRCINSVAVLNMRPTSDLAKCIDFSSTCME